LNRAQKLLNDETALKNEMLAQRAFRPEDAAAMGAQMAANLASNLSPLSFANLLELKGEELKVDPDVKHLLSDFTQQISGQEDNPVEPSAG
jgi:hypothetical protein